MNKHLGPDYETGVCDECCQDGDKKPKYVKRVELDNIYFCQGHYKLYQVSFLEVNNEQVEPWYQQ